MALRAMASLGEERIGQLKYRKDIGTKELA
jgi:hypothetical protein